VLTFALREDLDEISFYEAEIHVHTKDAAGADQVVHQQGFKRTGRRVREVDVSLRVYGEGIECGACPHGPGTG
jgi:hypothetical protein